MNSELALKFHDRYLENKRRLWYTFMPSTRKKVKNNINSALTGFWRNTSINSDIFTLFRSGLKEKLKDCEKGSFYDIEKIQDWIGVVSMIESRTMVKKEYSNLYYDIRFNEWFKLSNIHDVLNVVKRQYLSKIKDKS